MRKGPVLDLSGYYSSCSTAVSFHKRALWITAADYLSVYPKRRAGTTPTTAFRRCMRSLRERLSVLPESRRVSRLIFFSTTWTPHRNIRIGQAQGTHHFSLRLLERVRDTTKMKAMGGFVNYGNIWALLGFARVWRFVASVRYTIFVCFCLFLLVFWLFWIRGFLDMVLARNMFCCIYIKHTAQ